MKSKLVVLAVAFIAIMAISIMPISTAEPMVPTLNRTSIAFDVDPARAECFSAWDEWCELPEGTVPFNVDMVDAENVFQLPANDSVYPSDNVIVYANITDENGVKQATLNFTYTNSSGTWTGNVTMQELEENFYNGTIPHLPYSTNVTYIIIAEDNLNNIITTEEMGYSYKYHVIPEFPSLLILPLFTLATLLAVIVHKRKQTLVPDRR